MTKKRTKYFSILMLFALFGLQIGCKQPPPKVYPLQYEEDEFWRISQERGQERLKKENEQIRTFIKESTNSFELNKAGVWLSVEKVESPSFAKEGDVVKYGLEVRSIFGDVIYTFAEKGDVTMVMGKQKITRGLLTALKNTPLNTTSTALVPSSLAYGTFGDRDRIGTNETLVYKIKLNAIQKKSR